MLVRSSRILPWLMAAGLALGMTACASTDGARGTPEFQATGEVLSTRGTSVAFNDDRILGPEINLTRRTDGSWAGTINDTLVDIRVKEGNLHGIHIDLHWKPVEGGFRAQGLIGQRIVRVQVDGKWLEVQNGPASASLWRTGPGSFEDTQGAMLLKGEAQELRMPQTLLALLVVATDDRRTR
ncbi:MAG TPA: hypothetical protein VK013_01390 [Myxococcaceae bacterium]|nr:hypothetical protein [Myxococcaceae bacterium]